MKPSERRALKEAKEKPLEMENPPEWTDGVPDPDGFDIRKGHSIKNKRGKSILDDNVESMRKESFFQNHVKLITFIVTVSILFMLIGPFSIIRIIEMVEENKHFSDGETLTVEQIQVIARNRAMITWSDFDGYSYEDQSTKTTTVREYFVKEAGFYLVVRGPKSDPKYPDNVHFMYSDDNGTTFIDLRTEDIKGFLAAINTSDAADSLRVMTIDDLESLAEGKINISWASFKDFKYESSQRVEKEIVYYMREYKVAGTDFSIVFEGKKISGAPDTAIIINNITGAKKDLKRDDISDFIKE